MRFVVVSHSFNNFKPSGVGCSASLHVQWLKEAGHSVVCIPTVFKRDWPDDMKHDFTSFDQFVIKNLRQEKEDKFIIIIEGWHTWLSRLFIILRFFDKRIVVILFSHGSSFLPFRLSIKDMLRTIFFFQDLFFLIIGSLRGIKKCVFLGRGSMSRFLDLKIWELLVNNGRIAFFSNPISQTIRPKNTELRSGVVFFDGAKLKRKDRLIEIAQTMCDTEVPFYLISRGSYVNLPRNISLINGDDKEKIEKVLMSSRLILICSDTEVMPFAALEAISNDVAVLAVDRGLLNYFSPLCLKYDKIKFAEIINRIHGDDFYYHSCLSLQKQTLENKCDYEKTRDNFLKVVEN